MIYGVLLHGLLFVLFCNCAWGLKVFECVFMPGLLFDVVWLVFRCVFVLMCVRVLCLMSLHAVCALPCDDVWCSRCFAFVCLLFVFVWCVL